MRPTRAHNFGTYFIFAQTWERRRLFVAKPWADLFVATLYRYRNERKYLLHDFVLMPDHFHLILTPEGITLERSVQFLKGGFSHRAGTELRSGLEIWQKGFTDHRVRDAEDYLKHKNYTHLNPVRAGLCSRPEDYPYSSASGKFELDELPQRLKPLVQVAFRRG